MRTSQASCIYKTCFDAGGSSENAHSRPSDLNRTSTSPVRHARRASDGAYGGGSSIIWAPVDFMSLGLA
eukprot:1439376-Pleurochrysis_carterae.AAC.1